MNTLVVYDSQYGNTERIARSIADVLRSFGQAQAVRLDPGRSFDAQGVDLLILGSPTQGMRPTPAMQSFITHLSSQQSQDLTVACFDTRFRGFLWKHSAAPSMVKLLRNRGIESIVPSESFFVKAMKAEGPLEAMEEERARVWAASILLHLRVLHPQALSFEESRA